MTSKLALATGQIRQPKKSTFAGKSGFFWALFWGTSWMVLPCKSSASSQFYEYQFWLCISRTVLSCKSSTSLQFYYYCHPESRNSPSSREKDRSAKSVERNRLIIDYGLLKRPWRHLWRRQRIRKWKIISACLWRSPRRKYQINPKENQQSQWNIKHRVMQFSGTPCAKTWFRTPLPQVESPQTRVLPGNFCREKIWDFWTELSWLDKRKLLPTQI